METITTRRVYQPRSFGYESVDIGISPGENGSADIIWLFGTPWERGEFARRRAATERARAADSECTTRKRQPRR